MTHVAVIGAGWAGATAALMLARAGIHVTVFEANSIAGGRARVVEKSGHMFDNGQHLLLGAYARSLAMIDSLHGPDATPYIRLPLMLQSAPNTLLALRLPHRSCQPQFIYWQQSLVPKVSVLLKNLQPLGGPHDTCVAGRLVPLLQFHR
jgi:predicted NAD/FAD-binding protein